jgi:hypothetical protein
MASKALIDVALKLYKGLGGNLSKVLGTRSNVNFLGKGKSSELMVDMDINADALGVLPKSKAVEELDSAMGYLTSNKLNDMQANKLISNMQKMKDFYDPPAAPANITDMVTGTRGLNKEGLESLRAMADDLPPPGSRGGSEDIAAPLVSDAMEPTGAGLEAIKSVQNLGKVGDDIVNNIYEMAGVAKNAQPVARANARDFLNRVKDLEDPEFPGGTTLSSIMEPSDFKFMTEGGGGIFGDPLLIVQKYFGPKVASSVAQLDNANDIQKFAENLVKIKDAKGNSITSRYFDPESVDDFEFADGGKVPAADSQLVKETEGIMGYRGKTLGGQGIFPNFLKHGYFMEKRNPRTLEETEKLDTVKDIFDEDQPNIQDVVDLSEGFTFSPLTYLKRLLAEMEIKNTRKTKKADGGRIPYMAGMLVRGGKIGYQALKKYGIEGKDISRLFASLGSDKSLVGKEKTLYFQQLHKVLRNPDAFPDEVMDIQKQLGLDVGLGFKSGGLAGILEV